jgi:hypothetical protein
MSFLNEELKNDLVKKNIAIERLKYSKVEDSDSDDDDVKKIKKKEKITFYLEQLEISNKLILRKNMEIVSLTNKILHNEQVISLMDQYLERKEVKNVDLNLLENPTVNKLRILLREKAVFERELL